MIYLGRGEKWYIYVLVLDDYQRVITPNKNEHSPVNLVDSLRWNMLNYSVIDFWLNYNPIVRYTYKNRIAHKSSLRTLHAKCMNY